MGTCVQMALFTHFKSSRFIADQTSRGGYYFSRAVIPLLLEAVDKVEHPPTLIFTSATAGLKGSANCSSFATGKFALRALYQSLAREFGPKGLHVAHAIIDGVIDIERTKNYHFDAPDAKISPSAVSHTFASGHGEDRPAVTDTFVSCHRLPTLTGIYTLSPVPLLRTSLISGRTLRNGKRASSDTHVKYLPHPISVNKACSPGASSLLDLPFPLNGLMRSFAWSTVKGAFSLALARKNYTFLIDLTWESIVNGLT